MSTFSLHSDAIDQSIGFVMALYTAHNRHTRIHFSIPIRLVDWLTLSKRENPILKAKHSSNHWEVCNSSCKSSKFLLNYFATFFTFFSHRTQSVFCLWIVCFFQFTLISSVFDALQIFWIHFDFSVLSCLVSFIDIMANWREHINFQESVVIPTECPISKTF